MIRKHIYLIITFLTAYQLGFGQQINTDSTLHNLINDWHQAAATGDEIVFFEILGDSSTYIGTDPTERWSKKEFLAWAGIYFERDTAWAFTPMERKLYYSQSQEVAWFDETLDTWMGICRGSGVLEKKEDGDWQLQHYHLSIAIPNEKVPAYLKILKEN